MNSNPIVSVLDLPVDTGSGGVQIDTMQHPYGWTYLRLEFVMEFDISSTTTPDPQYYQIKDEDGSAMDFRALTGGYVAKNTDLHDKFKIELAVKGEDLGGVTPDDDVVLDQFGRDLHPINDLERKFFPPDRSMLLPTTADQLDPALPAVPIYFKVDYVASATNIVNPTLVCFLDGFEPPAS